MKRLTDKTLTSYRQSLGLMIKDRRDSKGISQARLAEMAGTLQSRIAEMEAGQIKNIDTFIQCVNALGGQIQFVWK